VDSRFQIQLEEDGVGSTGQSWMEKSGLWPMLHWERKGLSQSKSVYIVSANFGRHTVLTDA